MRTIVALLVLVSAGGVSFMLRRRQSDAPAPVRGAVPYQLNVKDFSCGDKKWLVAVFTSSTCDAVVMSQQRLGCLKAAKLQ